jgi:predicted TIM-barrel fold metal-dependent hydrolase
MTRRIDLHAHFIPDAYREFLVAASQGSPDGIKALPAWSAGAALEAMEKLEIEKAFLSISSPGVFFGDIEATRSISRLANEDAVHLREAHPGRFGFFACVPIPDVDAAESELDYALDRLGADGLVLQTNTAGVYLGDPRLEGLYARLDQRRSTLFIHPTTPHEAAHVALGYPRPMLEFIFETTRAVTQLIISGVLDRYPGMRVIVPHAGAALPILAARIELLLPILAAAGTVPPSVRDALKRVHFDLAGAPVPELLGALLSVADPSRIHYGSDFPFTPLEAALRLSAALDATEQIDAELRDSIDSGNARRVFA